MEDARLRFESYLEYKEDGCINWIGGKTNIGHGKFWYNNKHMMAHRFAWILSGNTIPDKYVIRHKCIRNRTCCNIDHLELGTQSENMKDRVRDNTLARGENVGTSKLSVNDVLNIRSRSKESYKILAEEYHVKEACIHKIVKRINWKHI
jgi:hypothetical protein